MQSRHYDALIIPTNDPHFSEYVAEHWQARQWLSGFSGSAGTAVITADQAIVSVDSRYFLQAEKQLAPGFSVLKQQAAHTTGYLDWIADELPAGSTVAIDDRLCSVNGVTDIGARLAKNDIELQLCEDPFVQLWSDRPPLPNSELFELDIAYSGVSRKDKLQSLRAALAGRAFLVTALDEIAWLLNLRGSDVEFNPVFYAWLLIEEKQATLCCDNPMPQNVRDALTADGITLRPYADITELLDRETLTVHCDCALLPAQLGQYAVDLASPITLQKAIKNTTELTNLQQAMLKDARALQAFYRWLKNESEQRTLSEWDCVEQLDTYRAQQGNYIGPSFAAIVGSRQNGAIVHYHPT
ncbi:MAG: M24 family metallopeptidase, partial [Gemmatimonadetes bacterium]|nr:M24 family metallopeptidase [Gemmatimonadota bacterium]